VKPTRLRSSTGTSNQSFAFGQPLLTFGVAPVAMGTALAAHFVLNTDLRFSLLVGVSVTIVVLAPQLLVSLVFVTLYALINTINALAGVIYVTIKREDPAKYFMKMLADATNVAISFQTHTPITLPLRTADDEPATQATQPDQVDEEPRSEPRLDPLPPAPGGARKEDTPHFWLTVQALSPESGGRPDVVSHPASGRHSRAGDDAPRESIIEAQQPTSVPA
jgi:hypothetical protein